jgi:uncharacterized protein
MMRKSIASAAAVFLFAGFAAFMFALAPVGARDTAPKPALWKIDGPAGDIYFFGSIHILPKDFRWRTPELEAAMADAAKLVFEIDLDEAKNPAAMTGLVVKYGFLRADQSLHKMLAPEHRRKLDEVAKSYGLDPAVIDRMRPWLVAITLSSLAIIKQSTEPGEPTTAAEAMKEIAGVDMQLWDWSNTSGKERGALETSEDQIRIFANLTHDQEVEFLIVTLQEVSKPPAAIDKLLEAWKAGDTEKLDRALNEDLNTFPALRKAVFTDRHEKWLPQIEAMMADGRTHLIVVGAAHLVGKGSVIDMLRAKGIKVEGP